MRRPNLTLCFVLEDEKLRGIREAEDESGGVERAILLAESVAEKVAEKVARKKSERFTYLMAAVMSSFGITSMAIVAVYYRFAWHMEVTYLVSQLSCIAFFPSQFDVSNLWRRVGRYLIQKCLVHLLSPLALL